LLCLAEVFFEPAAAAAAAGGGTGGAVASSFLGRWRNKREEGRIAGEDPRQDHHLLSLDLLLQ